MKKLLLRVILSCLLVQSIRAEISGYASMFYGGLLTGFMANITTERWLKPNMLGFCTSIFAYAILDNSNKDCARVSADSKVATMSLGYVLGAWSGKEAGKFYRQC